MKVIKEIRHDNLLRLIDEAKGTSNLANKTGIAVSYLLQIKNKKAIQNGKPKGIGDKIASKLEKGMEKPKGWLDQNHDTTTVQGVVMNTVKENRYNNLLLLVQEAGSMVRLEEKTGVTANYLRQIKNKNIIQNGKPKGIGDKIAAKLEDGMGKPRGWLDQDHGSSELIEPSIYLKENIAYLIDRKGIPNLAAIAARANCTEDQLQTFLDEPDTSNTTLLNALSDVLLVPYERLLYDQISVNKKGINLLKWFTYSAQPIQDWQDIEHQHRIDYLDVRMAAGMRNFENADYPEIIKSLWLSDDGMLELVGKRSADGIYLVNVPTDSMEPTILKGDIVFLDTKIDHYNGDGIYAFSVNGNLFVKRFQKLIKGGYKIISDNPKYDPEEMTDNEVDTTIFVGKFIRCWRIDTVDL